MYAGQDYIDGLIANPRESLATELKDWFDPRTPEGQAKIVKTCLAMRNHNGGTLQVGFEDGTASLNLSGAPTDVRSWWDVDELQALVSKFASIPFEVHLSARLAPLPAPATIRARPARTEKAVSRARDRMVSTSRTSPYIQTAY